MTKSMSKLQITFCSVVVFTTLALARLPCCFAGGVGEGHAGPEAGSESDSAFLVYLLTKGYVHTT